MAKPTQVGMAMFTRLQCVNRLDLVPCIAFPFLLSDMTLNLSPSKDAMWPLGSHMTPKGP